MLRRSFVNTCVFPTTHLTVARHCMFSFALIQSRQETVQKKHFKISVSQLGRRRRGRVERQHLSTQAAARSDGWWTHSPVHKWNWYVKSCADIVNRDYALVTLFKPLKPPLRGGYKSRISEIHSTWWDTVVKKSDKTATWCWQIMWCGACTGCQYVPWRLQTSVNVFPFSKQGQMLLCKKSKKHLIEVNVSCRKLLLATYKMDLSRVAFKSSLVNNVSSSKSSLLHVFCA